MSQKPENPHAELEREWFEGLQKGYFGSEEDQLTPTAWLKSQPTEMQTVLKDCVDEKSVSLNTSFHYAALMDYPNLIELLFVLSADVLVTNKLGSTPLHLACVAGNTDCVKGLVKYSIACDKTNKIGNTPLHCAVLSGSLDCVKMLVEELRKKFDDYNLRAMLKHANLSSYSPGMYAGPFEEITVWFKEQCANE